MKVTRIVLTLFFLLGLGLHAQAQQDRQFIRQGNRYFKQQKYDKAEVEYRKAMSQNAANSQAVYNLGCALQMQQKDSAAIVQYQNAGKMETSKVRKSQAFHNIGVICQSHQMYAEAMEAYKESLRNNPTDDQTRYNLALCKRLLKNQNQNGGNDNKDNKDKNKDKKDDDKKQQDDQQKQKQDPNQLPQQSKEQMSKENAEQLLNAAMQEEKATQQRLKKPTQQPNKRQLQKNW